MSIMTNKNLAVMKITTIYNNGINHKHYDVNADMLKPINELFSLSVCFETKEQRDEFVKQFPKSMNVKSNKFCNADIHFASLRIMIINEVTGDYNEFGDKRMNRFYNAVKLLLDLQGDK